MNLKSTKYANLVQDTKVNLDSTTKVFPAGIVIHESDSGKIKVSDGINLYKDLPYVGSDVPTDHSSTEPTFGIGTSEKYGHVKVAQPEGGVNISEVKEIRLSDIHTTEEYIGQYIDTYNGPVISSVAKSDITGNTVTVLRAIEEGNLKSTFIMKNSAGEVLDTYELTHPDLGGYGRFKVKYLNNTFMYYYVNDQYLYNVEDETEYTNLSTRLFHSDGSADNLDMLLIPIDWKNLVPILNGVITSFELKDITYNPNTDKYLLLGYINNLELDSDYNVYILHLTSDFIMVVNEEGVPIRDDDNINQSYTFKVLSDGTVVAIVVPRYSSGE